jgi:hypothetical protein
MNIYIDCEFNGHGGELISMALVAEDGAEFYEVLNTSEPIQPWVEQHVIPYLNKEPIPNYIFQQKLWYFLAWYTDFNLISDWPEDIKYFMQSIITKPGEMMSVPSFSCEVRRDLSSSKSKIPHNALEDCRAIAMLSRELSLLPYEHMYDNPFHDSP